MITTIGIAVALTLAASIGANNAGIAMGPAFGAGAIRKGWALALIGLFYILGAVTLGGRVVTAIGHDLFTVELAVNPWIFLLVAPTVTLVVLTLATALRLPISTTHAAVSSLIGVGLYLDVVRVSKVSGILAWWALTPLAALLLAWLAAKLVRFHAGEGSRKLITGLLLAAGAYVAFAIGSNNAANSMAPVVGGKALPPLVAVALAGAAMALGGAIWGGRVLETVGKGILELSHERSIVVALVSGTITIAASWFGVPISLTLVVATAIIGYSLGIRGVRETVGNPSIRRIVAAWTASPILAFAVTYGIVSLVG